MEGNVLMHPKGIYKIKLSEFFNHNLKIVVYVIKYKYDLLPIGISNQMVKMIIMEHQSKIKNMVLEAL